MEVENLAILDTVFDSKSFRTMLSNEKLDTNGILSQIVAIGAICNAASFENSNGSPIDSKPSDKAVSGNATGDFTLSASLYHFSLRWVDTAILRFSDYIACVELTRQRWINVYRAHFNSKVFTYIF